MTHEEIIQKIGQKELSEDVRRRGFFLSTTETIRDILVAKGIVTEGEYNRYYDKNLERNFQLK